MLIGYTVIRAHELKRQEGENWVIMSSANIHKPVTKTISDDGKVLELDPKFWNQIPLPNSICPTFETCNIIRHYELEVKVGLSWGSIKSINVGIDSLL